MKKISLRAKYSFALISIAIYTLLFHTTTINLIKNHDEYAQNINLTSKERVLVVKMLFSANKLYNNQNEKHKILLKDTISEFDKIELILKSRGHIFEKEEKNRYIESIKCVLDNTRDKVNCKIDDKDIDSLEKRYENLIKNIDNYILKLQKDSEESIEHLIFIKTSLLILLLLLLIFEAFFIFLPTEKEIKAKRKELIDINRDLEKRILIEIKKNEEQALQISQQSKLAQMGEMMNMIAHQWRQPLASISTISGTLSLDIIMNNYKADFFQKELSSIDELSSHLSSTIDEFRNFFKNDKEIQKEQMNKIVKDSLKIIAPCIETKNITISINIDEDIFINSYITEIKQVLLNIIKNAEDALLEKETPNATIWINGLKKEKFAELSIEDNGGGISEDILNKIFEPYFSTKKDKDGTGLGLYMSKIIIEDHCKGKLDVQNSEVGAKFTITIPLDTSKKDVQGNI